MRHKENKFSDLAVDIKIYSVRQYFIYHYINLAYKVCNICRISNSVVYILALAENHYTNAQNWFPNLNLEKQDKNQNASSYTLSIPSLGIDTAIVSTVDYDLAKHLVNYPGTEIPPRNGNSVIFGHSTLPQLFNPKDYKTIFATLYKIKLGDEIFVKSSGVLYKYSVYSIIVVDPLDTSIFAQSYDNSYLTLVTCTPPGTTWKRLIVKTRLEKI